MSIDTWVVISLNEILSINSLAQEYSGNYFFIKLALILKRDHVRIAFLREKNNTPEWNEDAPKSIF